jgi:hypothetical protein
MSEGYIDGNKLRYKIARRILGFGGIVDMHMSEEISHKCEETSFEEDARKLNLKDLCLR